MWSLQARGTSSVSCWVKWAFPATRAASSRSGKSISLGGMSCRPSSVSHHCAPWGHSASQGLPRTSQPGHLKKLYVIKCVINVVSFFFFVVYIDRKWSCAKKKLGEAKTYTHTRPLGISQLSFTCQKVLLKDSLILLYAACLQMALELKYSLSSL